MLACEECGCATEDARGWVAESVKDEEPASIPYVIFYCCVCAKREFSIVTPRGLAYMNVVRAVPGGEPQAIEGRYPATKDFRRGRETLIREPG